MNDVTELEKLVELGLTGSELRSWLERERAELSTIRAAKREAHLVYLENEHAEFTEKWSELQLGSSEGRVQVAGCERDIEAPVNIRNGEEAGELSGSSHVTFDQSRVLLKSNKLRHKKGGSRPSKEMFEQKTKTPLSEGNKNYTIFP